MLSAVMVIQSAYRGYKARQKVKMLKDMPDLRCAEVKEATVKIQAAYRGFQTRKKVKPYNAMEVVTAVIRIQSAFRAYKARKKVQCSRICQT